MSLISLIKFKNSKLIFLAVLPIIIYIFKAINVSKEITENDRKVIKSMIIDNSCKKLNSFESEIKCIEKIQETQSLIGINNDCRTGIINVEPMEFINENYGCCYDRARLTEKMLSYYGFKNRRIALYDLGKLGFLSLIIPNIDSHAAVEVKTKRGWLGIETNFYKSNDKNFLLIDENLKPYTFKNVINNSNSLLSKFDFKTNEIYKSKNTITIKGLYSRHGRFHYPYFPFLEINFNDFLNNFI